MIGIDESIDALQPGGKEKQREKMPSNSIAYCISRKRTCPEAWKYEDLIKKPTTKEKSEALFLEKQRTNVNSSSSTSFFCSMRAYEENLRANNNVRYQLLQQLI